ncbi:MAG: hypothetical protein ACLU3I_05935 [Acutalibacteraceae bacterium]
MYLKSQDGDVFNLKSALSEHIALGQLLRRAGRQPRAVCRPPRGRGPAHQFPRRAG